MGHLQLELAAAAVTTPSSSSPSVLGKGYVEEVVGKVVVENVEEAVMVGSGLVSLHRRGEVQKRDWEQGLGPGPGQEGQEAMEKEGEVQALVQTAIKHDVNERGIW